MPTSPAKPKPLKRESFQQVCQVCGELRHCDLIDNLMVDVSARFGLEELIYFVVDYCFDRRVCREGAQAMAARFAGGDDPKPKT